MWTPSDDDEVFSNDDRKELIKLRDIHMQKIEHLLPYSDDPIGKTLIIVGLKGGVVRGKILGYSKGTKFKPAGRWVFFETKEGFYGALDLVLSIHSILDIK